MTWHFKYDISEWQHMASSGVPNISGETKKIKAQISGHEGPKQLEWGDCALQKWTALRHLWRKTGEQWVREGLDTSGE